MCPAKNGTVESTSTLYPHARAMIRTVETSRSSNSRYFRSLPLALLFLFSTFFALEAGAQGRSSDDHRGTEFRLAFLHTNGDGEFPTYYLVVSSETPQNNGTLVYEATGKRVPINIPFANTPVRIRLDTFDLLMPNPVEDTPISKRTLTVEFDSEVTLYAINTLRWSSDGFLSLPVDAIGTDYTVMSYPNTAQPGAAGQIFATSDFPSQIAIIGTQDRTRVEIFPTESINARGNRSPFVIDLDRGEVFFGQAIDSRSFPGFTIRAGRDLTGTRIQASAPVVVYGSHQRSNIPFSDAVGRDHLVEQMPPTDKWGTRAMVLPHFQLEKTVRDSNFIRVVAARANTKLTIDSGSSITLLPGQPVEIPLDRPMLLTADQPIAVAQFQHSTVDVQRISMPNDTVGDPFMMLVPSREQFDTNYSFESWNTKDFLYHFINVVIPTERINTLRLDGIPVAAQFQKVPKTSYSYAQIRVTPGPHNVQARVPFGLQMYGYGPYNSYGMPGGWVFDSTFDDHIEPDITWRDSCNGVVGEAFDAGALDFGMEDVRLLAGSSNVNLVKEPFLPGDDSIRFRLDLVDPYQDGVAQLIAVDTAGLERRYTIPVYGFTVRLSRGEPLVVLDTLASLNGQEFCTRFFLFNYGQSEQTIEGLRLRDSIDGIRIASTFPIVLQPGERREVQICFQRIGDTATSIEVSVDNGCEARPVGILPVISGVDTLAPDVTRLSGDCDRDVVYQLLESGALSSGIAEVTVRAQRNAEIVIPLPSDLPGEEARIEIRRKSIWEDVVYDIEIVDVVGNRVQLTDTIGGLTLSVADASNNERVGFRLDPSVPWLYEELVFTKQDCDTIWLENTGLMPLDLYRLRFNGNLEFSLPPDQMPLLLQPGERFPLEVCVRPTAVGLFQDTLIIEFFCGQLIDVVEFQSFVKPLLGNGRDRCGNLIEVSVGGATKRDFLENPSPNPSPKGIATVTFGLRESRPVEMTLHDGNGMEVLRLLDSDDIAEGISRIHVDVSELSSGRYYLRMDGPKGESFVRPIVIKE